MATASISNLLAWHPRLGLLRLVREREAQHRDSGRRIAKGFAAEQSTAQMDRVERTGQGRAAITPGPGCPE